MTGEDHSKSIEINSEKFFNMEIKIGDVLGWLKTIFHIAKVDDLNIALKKCYSYVLDEEQSRAVGVMTELIYQEASGKIIPPINLTKTFRNIANGDFSGAVGTQ